MSFSFTTNFRMFRGDEGSITTRHWLWRTFFKSAIVPLLFVELAFLGIFMGSNWLVYHQNVAAQRSIAEDGLDGIARRESAIIAEQFEAVEHNTQLLARLMERALTTPQVPTAAEKARHGLSPNGSFYSLYDNGTTASYLSAYRPISANAIDQVWRLAPLDPVMIEMQKTHPTVASIYVNTTLNYNRIYPYFDVLKQYPELLDLTTYNFYYEADARHNPARKAVWTKAYADPAGHGWMISSIAPVWIDNRLEAVVGQDVTLKSVIGHLRNLNIPWGGYAVLIDDQGQILAMPPKAEKALGVRELTDFTYAQTVKKDTFKPQAYNLSARPETQRLAKLIRTSDSGRIGLKLGGEMVMVGFKRIPGLEWRLAIVAPEQQVFGLANEIRTRQRIVGGIMALMLVVFYGAFLAYLSGLSRTMGSRITQALSRLSAIFQEIGQGRFHQQFSPSGLDEVDRLGAHLVATGHKMGNAYQTIVDRERALSNAVARQRQASEEQSRFLRVMSHEIRTPLAIIDSSAQILARKADTATPQDLTDRASRVQRAVERIARLLETLGHTIERETEARKALGQEEARLHEFLATIASDVVPADRLELDLPPEDASIVESAPVGVALRAVLDNAVRYSLPGHPIRVSLTIEGRDAVITVADAGPGIPAGDMDKVGERFFRGSNAKTTPGAGVGIYVARKVMESAGGSLEIASSESGTIATQRVPLGDREAA